MSSTDGGSHFERLEHGLHLEAIEARSEVSLSALSDRQLRSSGLGLVDLEVMDEHPGFGDRRQLVLDVPGGLGRHGLGVGQPVRLWASGERERPGVPGSVVRRGPRLVVEVHAEAEVPAGKLRVEPTPDEVTHRRVAADLQRARVLDSSLTRVLLGHQTPRHEVYEGWLAGDLDEDQARAARHALGALDVALVHGPPGTGKTRTLSAIIQAAVRAGESVLVLAPSHAAVDNLASRLATRGLELIRLGHPARVDPELLDHTLEAKLERHESVRLARRYRRDAAEAFRSADRFTRARPAPGEKAAARKEGRALLADAKKLEANAARALVDEADVVLATLGVHPERLGARHFDWVVVDEAAQATEASSWRAVIRGERLVLAGDHRQLPPTVRSRAALEAHFGVSLFERLMTLIPESACPLRRQYRMHAEIMSFPNASMYEGALQADPSVAEHRLVDLAGVRPTETTQAPFRFIDTAGAGFEETPPDGEGPSRINLREADVLVQHVRAWLDAGVAASDIGVITPYAAQARALEDRLGFQGVEVDTVDGFQGREKEAIAISLVRSNPEAQVGFLSEHRRTNVALTRARRALLVIGDGATLGSDPYFAELLADAAARDGLVSVWEIPGAV